VNPGDPHGAVAYIATMEIVAVAFYLMFVNLIT
jgi:hypothetical protein